MLSDCLVRNLNSGIIKSYGNKYIILIYYVFLVFKVNLRYMYNFKSLKELKFLNFFCKRLIVDY